MTVSSIPVAACLTLRSPISLVRADSQTARHKPALSQPLRDSPVPFRVGETLHFTVSWSAFSTAATARLTIADRREFSGSPAWHFQAFARTENPVRSLITVDDQFDSYADTSTLFSRQYEMDLDELGRKVNRVLRLQPQEDKHPSSPPAVIVPRGTRDPLNAFYDVRAVDWRKSPEFVAPVFDGHDVYEMHARLDVPSEDVAVPAGRFSASRISVTALQGGKPVPGIHLTIWIARDSARTPVQVAAELPFATLHAVLAAEH